MQPLTLQDLKNNPANNPEVALYLIEGAAFVPVLLALTFTFDADSGTTSGSSTSGSLGSPIGAMTWVNQLKYVVERKNADVGSALKGQNDYYTGLCPYVDVNLLVPYAPISYLLTPQYVALGTLADTCIDWTLRKNATVTGKAQLTRDLQSTENPYVIKMTLIGYQINPIADLENIIGRMERGDMLRACGCGGIDNARQQGVLKG